MLTIAEQRFEQKKKPDNVFRLGDLKIVLEQFGLPQIYCFCLDLKLARQLGRQKEYQFILLASLTCLIDRLKVFFTPITAHGHQYHKLSLANKTRKCKLEIQGLLSSTVSKRCLSCRGERARTSGLRDPIATRYQLRHTPFSFVYFTIRLGLDIFGFYWLNWY